MKLGSLMKLFILSLLFCVLPSLACDGGMNFKNSPSIPENSLYANDMTEKEFKTTLKNFEAFFSPAIDNEHNRELIIFGSWASNTVNSYAEQGDKKVMITVYGALPDIRRSPMMVLSPPFVMSLVIILEGILKKPPIDGRVLKVRQTTMRQ